MNESRLANCQCAMPLLFFFFNDGGDFTEQLESKKASSGGQ